MSLNDWTEYVEGGGSSELDASTKYAGASSLRFNLIGYNNWVKRTHSIFSESQVEIIFWVREQYGGRAYIGHSSYGEYQMVLVDDTWEKWKMVCWYESVENIKFRRMYKWVGGEWVQQGTDANCGTGAPAVGSIYVKGYMAYSGGGTKYVWFDELEVYS